MTWESTLTFDYGFDHPCSCSLNPIRYYDGWGSFDAAADIGALTLNASANAPCLLGPSGWTSPSIGTGTDVCNTPALPNIDLKPIQSITVRCQVFAGVAYGVCEVAIKHAGGSGFGTGYSYLRYRLVMGTDCKIPLGDYNHYETVLYSTCVDGQNCERTCIIEQEAIWNLVPGKVTIS